MSAHILCELIVEKYYYIVSSSKASATLANLLNCECEAKIMRTGDGDGGKTYSNVEKFSIKFSKQLKMFRLRQVIHYRVDENANFLW